MAKMYAIVTKKSLTGGCRARAHQTIPGRHEREKGLARNIGGPSLLLFFFRDMRQRTHIPVFLWFLSVGRQPS